MAHLIPERPDFRGSTAEQTVWTALCEQLPDDATLIHGQRLTLDNRDVEIDLLVLWPGQGIAVIEVKGGRVGVADGHWHTTNGQGHRNRLKRSPVEQAMVAKHTLIDYLRRCVSTIPGPVVHLAAFPYTELPGDWTVPEAEREILIDATQLDRAAEAVALALRRAFDPDRDEPFVTFEHVLKNLRRTHEAIENVQLRAAEIEDAANVLTVEQEKLIRILRHQRRAEISGGAGSGKTHLALIKARTLAKQGLRVALMCYSRGLGRYLELTTASWPEDERPAYVGLFHDLPISWGAPRGTDDDSEYWEVTLPTRLKQLADERPRIELFDAIVIDEGQDFSKLWWEAVQSCLRNQSEGILYVFTDELQRIFDRYGDSPITMSPFQLDENLRNSVQIAEAFGYLADEAPVLRNGSGEEVEYIDVPAEDAVATADGVVERLLDDGWAPGDIALLTTFRRHPVQREIVETEGNSAYWDQFFARENVFYGHVLGFKGLERRAVVLCVNGFRDLDRAREMLYVGMSRARAKLVVVGDQQFLAGLADLIDPSQ
ncbi:ATP-binding domain-containing protein [Brevibacterium daeguense]|uniref:ATP-binding domain-containing protein n=1 Tax=Brevibacterium daeguense TaxID=909936 RepID=A0ABP8EK43_9MICO|nr:NERD domain-containing protein [Brevibacterium daeguense]